MNADQQRRTMTALQPPLDTVLLLLVDDDDQLRNSTTKLLQRTGYQVTAASSGSRAIELLRNHDGPFDVAIIDLMMPGMDGLETLRALRELQPGLKVILVSGYTEHVIETSQHIDEFLSKPFVLTTLTTTIERCRASGMSP